MEEKRFLNAQDVAEYLEVSKSMAYKLIQQLNRELKEQGYITIAGKVSRVYFEERTGANINLYTSADTTKTNTQKRRN